MGAPYQTNAFFYLDFKTTACFQYTSPTTYRPFHSLSSNLPTPILIQLCRGCHFCSQKWVKIGKFLINSKYFINQKYINIQCQRQNCILLSHREMKTVRIVSNRASDSILGIILLRRRISLFTQDFSSLVLVLSLRTRTPPVVEPVATAK